MSRPSRFVNEAGQEVPVKRSFHESDDLEDVWDEEGFIYCGHGLERCNVCCTDHRIGNEIQRAGARARARGVENFDPASKAHLDYLQDCQDARQQAVMSKMAEVMQQRGDFSMSIEFGTPESQELQAEVEARFAAELPRWPPLPVEDSPGFSAERFARREEGEEEEEDLPFGGASFPEGLGYPTGAGRSSGQHAGAVPPAAATFLEGFRSAALWKAEKLAQNSWVEIHGLQGKPELNGLVGQVKGYVKDKERYAIDVDPATDANKAALAERAKTNMMTKGGTTTSSSAFDSSLSFSQTSRFSLQQKNLRTIPDLAAWVRALSRPKKRNYEGYTQEQWAAIPHEEWQEYLKDSSDDGESSDGSLCTSKIARNEKREAKVRAKNLQRFPGMARVNVQTREDHLGLSSKNPAYSYPKEGEKPVLVIGGVGMVDDEDGTNFTAREILRTSPELWKKWGCRFLSFKHGESRKAAAKIVEAIGSGKYWSIILADLSHAFEEFSREVGPSLQSFVREFGGSVAFTSASGDEMVRKALKPLFPEIQWTFGAYYRATHCAVQRNRENVERLFGAVNADRKFSAKGCMLDNVPEQEQYFATGQEAKLFRAFMPDDYDEENDPDEQRLNTIVAVKQFPLWAGKNKTGHGGKLAYFGDVNGEEDCAALCVRFVQSEGTGTVEIGYTREEA